MVSTQQGVRLGKVAEIAKKQPTAEPEKIPSAPVTRQDYEQLGSVSLSEELEKFVVPMELPKELYEVSEGIQKMKPIHVIMLDLYCQGITLREISKTIGLSYTACVGIASSSLFRIAVRQRLANQSEEIKNLLAAQQIGALTNIRKLAENGKTDSIRFQANKWLLEVGGHSPVQKQASVTGDIGDVMKMAMEIADKQRKKHEDEKDSANSGFETVIAIANKQVEEFQVELLEDIS